MVFILYRIIRTKGAVGLPLNVGGKPWQEETVLHVMKELESPAKYSSVIQLLDKSEIFQYQIHPYIYFFFIIFTKNGTQFVFLDNFMIT